MNGPFEAVTNYILAKDGNRPHLLNRSFSDDIELEMAVHSDAISFPRKARGRGPVGDILCSRFALEYENVYTFVLNRPDGNRRHFPCHWLVGMSARQGGAVRVGCGCYDWYFALGEPCLACKLRITIEEMQIFQPQQAGPIFGWLSALDYPWCEAAALLAGMPENDDLDPIRNYLRKARPLPVDP